MSDPADGSDGPTVLELMAIEAEWPLYAAELAVVEAECRFVSTPDVLTRRALRRAVAALTRAYAEFYGTGAPLCPSLAHYREDLIREQGVMKCSTSK